MSNVDPAQLGGWHLDKRLPIALIVTLFLQFSAIVWWGATATAQIDARLDHAETNIDGLKAAQSVLMTEVAAQGRADVAISEQLVSTNAALGLLRDDVRETNSLLREILRDGRTQTERNTP